MESESCKQTHTSEDEQKPEKCKPFNFDEWTQLARDNPEAFERKREQAIQEVLLNSRGKDRQRLQGLNWRIGMERKKNDSALESLSWMLAEMSNTLCKLGEATQTFEKSKKT